MRGSCLLDSEMESCEEDRSILKRRLAASAVEIERQVLHTLSENEVGVILDVCFLKLTPQCFNLQRMKCFP